MKENEHERTPQKSNFLEVFTVMASIMGHIGLFLQAAKIFYLHSSYALSFPSYLIALFSASIWLYYGIKRNIRPLIIANYIGIAGILAVLVGILMYD